MDQVLKTLKSVTEKGIVYETLMDEFIDPLFKASRLSSVIHTKAKKELDVLRKKNQKNKESKNDETYQMQTGDQTSKDRYSSFQNNGQRQQQQQSGRGLSLAHGVQQQYMYGQVSTDALGRLNDKLEKYKTINVQLETANERLQKALQHVKAEANDYRLRFSKVAGDALKLNNPNIADLSDNYRPTNLGKNFAELYDNEWSDAFEEIDRKLKDEHKSVEMLHDIVQKSFKMCEKKAELQEEKIRDILLDIEDGSETKEDKDKTGLENLHNILIEVRKNILPRSSVNVAKNFVQDDLMRHLSAYDITKPGTKLAHFALKCTELCWCMHMCDPPMGMSSDSSRGPYDKNVYREYTRSVKDLKEPVIEFVVWPALRINVGGNLISKGVAQPCGKGKKK